MEIGKYHGVWPVIVTPYDEQGKVDLGAYRALVQWYVEQGVHGVFSLCLASEMYLLAHEERLALVRTAVEQCGGRIPVAATGSLGDDPQSHVALCRQLADAGADVVILTLPTFCTTEDELKRYFLDMAETLDVELGVYECPRPAPRHLSRELVGCLAATGRFGPFKETSCQMATIKQKLCAAEGTPLAVLQANTGLFVEACRAGAPGMMGIIVNTVPRLSATTWSRLTAGEDVTRLHELMCLAEGLMLVRHPLATKVLLQLQGLDIRPTSRRKDCAALTEGIETLLAAGWRGLAEMIDTALAEQGLPNKALLASEQQRETAM